MLKLVRETMMAIERSFGLIDESRDLIERSRGTIHKIQPIPCAKCRAKQTGSGARRIRLTRARKCGHSGATAAIS